MKKLLLALALISLACAHPDAPDGEAARWQARAEKVTIIRDDWGVPHIYAESDADAAKHLVFRGLRGQLWKSDVDPSGD